MSSAIVANENIDVFLAHLKKATAPMHERLEQSSLSKRLMAPDISLQDYIAYLEKMQGVILFCEQTVFPLLSAVLPDLQQRKKLALVQNDLKELSDGKTIVVHTPYRPFTNANAAFAMGYMYVIEGSVLGGRIILKQLAPRLNITAESGGSFFAGYGNETSAKWKSFLTGFATWSVAGDSEEEVIKGAQHAFESIYNYFEQTK